MDLFAGFRASKARCSLYTQQAQPQSGGYIGGSAWMSHPPPPFSAKSPAASGQPPSAHSNQEKTSIVLFPFTVSGHLECR